MKYPTQIFNWFEGVEIPAHSGKTLKKYDPSSGKEIAVVPDSDEVDANNALTIATNIFPSWSITNPIERAKILRKAALLLEERGEEGAFLIATELGKSLKDARGEINASVAMAYFVAGEGLRLYGKTTPSAVENRLAFTVREPVGVSVLITPFNGPLAGPVYKVFPALMCGNTVVLKPSELTPASSIFLAKILRDAGLPKGVVSVVHGRGDRVGQALVSDPRSNLISFTGSVRTGKIIQEHAGKHLARVALELGGKNAFVVCYDANIEQAVKDALSSAFSASGQRCASGSRIIVEASIYENFKTRFMNEAQKLSIGTSDTDFLGPIISEHQHALLVTAVSGMVKRGGVLLTGGNRPEGAKYKDGYFFSPTIFENVPLSDEVWGGELFGPVTCLYKSSNISESIKMVNESAFGLTSAIHTKNISIALRFARESRTGVVSINGRTFGSEPHLPFGGYGLSGTGWREAGTEALDIYSEIKTVYMAPSTE